MALTMRDFAPAMGFLCEMLPMQRALSDEALAMAWETMPGAAKIHLTRESLAFAVKQRLVDPAPPKDQALHVQLLRYVFPLERTVRRERGEEVNADRVLLENGPRADLAERMAAPDRFHDPAPARHEHAPPPERLRLPGGGRPWHPSQMTAEQRAAHLQGVAAAMQRLRDGNDTGRGWRADDSRLAQGRWWFQRCIDGFWPLQADDGGIAGAWIMANSRLADDLLQQAESAPKVLPPAEEVVAGVSIQGVNPWR